VGGWLEESGQETVRRSMELKGIGRTVEAHVLRAANSTDT
jgi:hypothetical protein